MSYIGDDSLQVQPQEFASHNSRHMQHEMWAKGRQLIPGQADGVDGGAELEGLDRGEFDLEYYLKPGTQADYTDIRTLSDFENSCMAHLPSRGPERDSALKETSNVIDETGELFTPKGILNFSALDETSAVEEILPQGLNRSVSTPNRVNPDLVRVWNSIPRDCPVGHESDLIYFTEQGAGESFVDGNHESTLLFSPLKPDISEINMVTDKLQLEQHASPSFHSVTETSATIARQHPDGDLPAQINVAESRNILVNIPKMTLDRSEGESPNSHQSTMSEVSSVANNSPHIIQYPVKEQLLTTEQNNNLRIGGGKVTNSKPILSNLSNNAGNCEGKTNSGPAPSGIPRFSKPTASSMNKSRVLPNEDDRTGRKNITNTKQVPRQSTTESGICMKAIY